MADHDPFDVFRKQKESDSREERHRQREEAAQKCGRLDVVRAGHTQILEAIRRFDPEPIVMDLYNAGFRANPRYDASVVRHISVVLLTDDGSIDHQSYLGESTTIAGSCRRRQDKSLLVGVLPAIGVVTGRGRRREIERRPHYFSGHLVSICVTEVAWHLVLYEATEGKFDDERYVPIGPRVELRPAVLTVEDAAVSSTVTPVVFAQILTEATRRYLASP